MISLSAQAQEVALTGKWMLGGSVGFTNFDRFAVPSNQPHYKSRGITFSPTVGYFFNNRWQVGIRGQYQKEQDTQDWAGPAQFRSFSENLTQSSGLGAYLRRYIWMFDHFAFHIEANISYSEHFASHHYRYDNDSQNKRENKKSSVAFSLNPGFTIKVNKWIGIDLSANLLRLGQDNDQTQSINIKQGQEVSFDEWNRNTFNATLASFSTLLNEVQIGIIIFI